MDVQYARHTEVESVWSVISERTKRCSRCLADRPVSQFYKQSANADGLQSRCRDCKLRYDRDRYAVSSRAYRLLRAARSRACKNGLELSLTLDWVEERLKSGVCELTGIPFTEAPRHPFLPSLDRIDPRRGYLPDNCRAILWMLNAAKQALPEPEFRSALQQIARAVCGQG
jgi:hypothetical protein